MMSSISYIGSTLSLVYLVSETPMRGYCEEVYTGRRRAAPIRSTAFHWPKVNHLSMHATSRHVMWLVTE